jgi:hypothetical protein
MSSKSQASLQSNSSGQMRLVTNQLLVAHIGFGLKLTCFFSFCMLSGVTKLVRLGHVMHAASSWFWGTKWKEPAGPQYIVGSLAQFDGQLVSIPGRYSE